MNLSRYTLLSLILTTFLACSENNIVSSNSDDHISSENKTDSSRNLIDAGYCENGFQLYKNTNGRLTKLIEYNPNNWGSLSAKWLNDTMIVVKNETYQKQFYTRLTIKNYD